MHERTNPVTKAGAEAATQRDAERGGVTTTDNCDKGTEGADCDCEHVSPAGHLLTVTGCADDVFRKSFYSCGPRMSEPGRSPVNSSWETVWRPRTNVAT